ncbi:hypothetical protein [Embleya sp. NPDC050493]|uniref:hypothetical protein n=1 Tax=Embleya sp. NPDC050493 TaxID=3363989 RepID=UPI0037A9A009
MSDGCNSLKVPETEADRTWVGLRRNPNGWAGYLTLRLVALVETGTCGLLAAAMGSSRSGELTRARALLPHLGGGMPALLDRAYDVGAFLPALADTGAHLVGVHLSMVTHRRRIPGVAQRPRGSPKRCAVGDARAVRDAPRIPLHTFNWLVVNGSSYIGRVG